MRNSLLGTPGVQTRHDYPDQSDRILALGEYITDYRTPNLPIRSAVKSSTISTARLNALPRLHLRPINQIISLGSYLSPQCSESGEPNLKAGFPLRCFQRLSIPNVATQRCLWRDNWYTSGSSTPVLSY